MQSLVDTLNDLLWTYSLIPILLAAGLYFSWRLGFVQLRRFPSLFGVLRSSTVGREESISSFKAFATSLGSKVGTGNIIGVATALVLGGPGAVFWMWVVAFLGMATAMIEATLAQVYKRRDTVDGKNVFRGGPAYYLESGLGMRKLGVLFSLLLIFGGFAFAMLQANSMAAVTEEAFGIPPIITGVAVAILLGMVVAGGIRRIATVAEVIVPFMALGYVAVALLVMAHNLPEIPGIFVDIFAHAFGLRQGAAGLTGWLISQALLNGVRRGMYSNDAGAGSAPNFAATADVAHPGNQGYIQALGVFADTMIVCTATAVMVLLSGKLEPGSTLKGAELTSQALRVHLGGFGPAFIAVALSLFAFTSAIGNYYQGENGLVFIEGDHRFTVIFKVLLIASVFAGTLIDAGLAWDLADVAQGTMALVNVYAIARLSPVAIAALRDYERQQRAGREPEFDPGSVPAMGSLHPGVWDARTPDAISR
ncbi:MAG: alanine/glycine:cation symporter family protein [Candidatus Nanopelagicales bacterium]